MKIVVGLSGGVDSAVAAYLMKKAGHEVIAIFMRNWNDDSVILNDECPWIEDSTDALLVAEKLSIPFQVIDLSTEYKKRIVDYMFNEYEKGRTPNPDILCNREVKFDLFLKIALELGAEGIATGHYVRKTMQSVNGKYIHQLKSGIDPNKDQSYFLCQLSQEQLAYAHFPIGEMLKPQVRELAKEVGLDNWSKKDSQGLCFIGKVSLPDFLQQKLSPKKGQVIEIPDSDVFFSTPSDSPSIEEMSQKIVYCASMGEVVGEHSGAHFYTKGQRKGLRIGGKAEPLFVLDTDIENNIVFVGQGKGHRGLYRKVLSIDNDEMHWVNPDFKEIFQTRTKVQARIRYRQPLQSAELILKKETSYLLFEEKQFAIAEGQFAAWYLEDELIGSGVIAG